MSDQPLTTEDLAAALTGFAVCLTAALMSPRHQTPNEVLEALANELSDTVAGMKKRGDDGSPASQALALAAQMLIASEVQR